MAKYIIGTTERKDITRTYEVESDNESEAKELLYAYVYTDDKLKHTLINADKVKLIYKDKGSSIEMIENIEEAL